MLSVAEGTYQPYSLGYLKFDGGHELPHIPIDFPIKHHPCDSCRGVLNKADDFHDVLMRERLK